MEQWSDLYHLANGTARNQNTLCGRWRSYSKWSRSWQPGAAYSKPQQRSNKNCAALLNGPPQIQVSPLPYSTCIKNIDLYKRVSKVVNLKKNYRKLSRQDKHNQTSYGITRNPNLKHNQNIPRCTLKLPCRQPYEINRSQNLTTIKLKHKKSPSKEFFPSIYTCTEKQAREEEHTCLIGFHKETVPEFGGAAPKCTL